jgi:AraC-like DNA-binding protein
MQDAGPEFRQGRFSTRHLPERERIASWREEIGRNVLRLDIEPIEAGSFRAEAKLRALPGLRTVHCAGSAARFVRHAAMTKDGEPSIGLVINFGTIGTATQRGRDVRLGSGDATPFLSSEASVLTGTQHLGVLVPRAALASRLRHVDDAGMKLVHRSNEPLRLLTKYMKLVHEKLELQTPELRVAMVNHIHDLVALVLSANEFTSDHHSSAVTHARLKVALNYIAVHFNEPDLSVADVARDQGISPRYLQRLFETTGMTFTEQVTELRLRKAFALLTEAGTRKRRISDIALQAGFSDLSHFNLLFRRRFQDTPSGVLTHSGRNGRRS